MQHDARTQAAIDAGHPEWAELPVSRKEAKIAGAPQFFDGQACPNGHVSTWQTSAGCLQCSREKQRSKSALDYNRRYMQEWRKTPKGKAAEERASRTWRKTPKGRAYDLALQAQRRAQKRFATPPWLISEHIEQMRAIYAEAVRLTDETGTPHHVDHIIPLNHPDVCGLHILANLQILTGDQNRMKNNSFDGTMDNEGWRTSRPRGLGV